MAAQRWLDAARCLDELAAVDPAAALQRRLADNMAAARQHQPRLYDTLVAAGEDNRYIVTRSRTAALTVAARRADGRLVALSANNDPKAALQQHRAQLAPSARQTKAIVLCGVGDGYMLHDLVAEPFVTPTPQRQVVFLAEPDAACLLACFMVHDCRDVLAEPRIYWLVGDDFDRQLAELLDADMHLPHPAAGICQGLRGGEIQQRVSAVLAEHDEQINRLDAEARRYYSSLSTRELADALGDDPPRQPRVLLMTTRFTTVLQHATRDVADAFGELGWDVRLLVEPSDHHAIPRAAVLAALHEQRPDLVLVIDHLRGEYDDLFPPQLPFACWAQDHLPKLMSADAGRAMATRDFLLTSVAPMYTTSFSYPPRQCIDLPKLTRPPWRPTTWRSDGDDLVYVSNASATPAAIRRRLLQRTNDADVQTTLARCCDELTALYEGGQHIATLHDMRQFVDAFCDARLPAQTRRMLVHLLFHPLNDALYRQQALRWTRDVALQRGLTLSIHGEGWDAHPDFADHARGPVAYGRPLEDLTRRSKVNLQIVPYYCLHQRLLDGLAAGGFFLIREHPTDTLLPQFAAFLDETVGDEPQTLDAVRDAMPERFRDAFIDMLNEIQCLMSLLEPIDPVAWARACQRAGLFDGGAALPQRAAVSFDSREQLERCLETYLDAPQKRSKVAERQRRSVCERLTYAHGMRRVVREIGRRLGDEAEAAGRREVA